MSELYKNKSYQLPQAERNTAILRRLENDVSELTKEVKELKEVLSFIHQYIKDKKEREDAKWFY
tara:strand:- start:767 stop:958 length:192 start_codon:yes stop_codon:yes gene_type:complete